MGYNSIAWLPLCAGLTILGLVLSYLVGRRRGHLSMLRGAAWSLLPIAAYLTGSVEMFWKIGAAIGHYADGFVFSPVKWAGIAVAGISALLFFATSGRGRRRAARLARGETRHNTPAAGTGTAPGAVTPGSTGDTDLAGLLEKTTAVLPGAKSRQAEKPQKPEKPQKSRKASKSPADEDDDMKDIENILRNRGL